MSESKNKSNKEEMRDNGEKKGEKGQEETEDSEEDSSESSDEKEEELDKEKDDKAEKDTLTSVSASSGEESNGMFHVISVLSFFRRGPCRRTYISSSEN